MDVQDLVNEFAESVVAQDEAIEKADPKTGNGFAKYYVEAFGRIRSLGDEGREALAALLTDQRANVRVMAAAFLLRYKHDEARAVLEKESRGTGSVAFGAKQALSRWEEGIWSLDP